MSVPFAALHAVQKCFAQRVILDGADLALARGTSYVLTGDNGCGKTTLLRILAGLEPAQSGTIRFEEVSVPLAEYPEHLHRSIVYVHQHPYLFHTSVAHNIAYGLKLRGLPRSQWERQVRDAIEWAGVGHLTDSAPHKLSGGETQRVALARARVLEPQLLLLDEPTASLDAQARRHTIELIERLGNEAVTVVVACHDREIAGLPGMVQFRLRDGHVYSS